MDRIRAPVRCFLSEISSIVANEQKEEPNEPLQFRLIGTIVSMEARSCGHTLITIDDGTALAHVQSVSQKATDIYAHLGMAVECIVDAEKETGELHVQSIFSLKDDPDEVPLRWLELSYLRQNQQNGDSWLGFPEQRPGPDDLFMVITGVCRPDEDNARPDAGASLDELAACFGLEPSEALSIIHQLQVSAVLSIIEGCLLTKGNRTG